MAHSCSCSLLLEAQFVVVILTTVHYLFADWAVLLILQFYHRKTVDFELHFRRQLSCCYSEQVQGFEALLEISEPVVGFRLFSVELQKLQVSVKKKVIEMNEFHSLR